LSFADEGCNVFGGHLEEGCIVKKGTDILLLSFEQKIINISSNDLLKNEDLPTNSFRGIFDLVLIISGNYTYIVNIRL